MLTIDNFDAKINATIVQRGLAYFEDQTVDNLEETSPGNWCAMVEGSEDYEVEVVLAQKNITSTSCDCPYDGGPICKHIVAVLYALREKLSQPRTKKTAAASTMDFEGMLQKISLEELREFVRHLKKENRDFSNVFMLYFTDKNPSIDTFGKYREWIRQLVRKHTSKGFIAYRQSFAFSKETQTFLNTANTAIARNNYRDAFAIGKALCLEIFEAIQHCDDSAGNIGDVLEESILILNNIAEAENTSPEMRDQLFAFVVELLADKDWFEFGDFGFGLLTIAENLALRTGPDAFLQLLDRLLALHVGEYTAYRLEHFIEIKIRFLQSAGQTAAAEQLIAQNRHIISIRERLVQRALDKKDYVSARQLILEGIQIAQDKEHFGHVNLWEKKLLELARLSNDIDAVRYISSKIAFERGFNKEYYQLWKNTYTPAEWPAVITEHIRAVRTAESKTPRKSVWHSSEHTLFFQLAPIFIEEKMWQELLDLLPANPGEGALSSVHPHLAMRFPAEMLAHYVRVINELGERAGNRKDYQHLADLMKKVKKDIDNSSTVIDNLAASLIAKYPRRPAMLEELTRVVRKR